MDSVSLVQKDITLGVANVPNVLIRAVPVIIKRTAQPVRTISTWSKITAQMFAL